MDARRTIGGLRRVEGVFDRGVEIGPTRLPRRGPGWTVSVNTVADSMRRQGLQGRKPKRRRGLTRQDRSASEFPDLLHRDFTAAAPNVKWCGDITEIPTDEGKLYLASVLDLHSRRLLASATSEHPDAWPGLRRDQDGRHGARWTWRHRWCDLPHRLCRGLR